MELSLNNLQLTLHIHSENWTYAEKLPDAFDAAIILYMCPASERQRYNVRSPLIGWVHIQNDPCWCAVCMTGCYIKCHAASYDLTSHFLCPLKEMTVKSLNFKVFPRVEISWLRMWQFCHVISSLKDNIHFIQNCCTKSYISLKASIQHINSGNIYSAASYVQLVSESIINNQNNFEYIMLSMSTFMWALQLLMAWHFQVLMVWHH